MGPIVVMAFYKFVAVEKHTKLKKPMLEICNENNIKGTILLAAEGINGTVSGPRAGIDALIAYFESTPYFTGLSRKESVTDDYPFYRMKIKIKDEIVTLRQPGVNPALCVGTYVKPKDWNALIQDKDVVLLDTRNIYEYNVGTFKGAVNPNTTNFCEFPDFIEKHYDPKIHKKVAMFCTGGIRCEKASSFMLSQGFEHVYHLEGGILKYLEEVPESESLWQGECFVFDNRVTVNHQLQPGSYDMCHACREPISDTDKLSPHYEPEVTCPHCYDAQTPQNRARALERAKQMKLAHARGERHVGHD